jgi:hypothetical protein
MRGGGDVREARSHDKRRDRFVGGAQVGQELARGGSHGALPRPDDPGDPTVVLAVGGLARVRALLAAAWDTGHEAVRMTGRREQQADLWLSGGERPKETSRKGSVSAISEKKRYRVSISAMRDGSISLQHATNRKRRLR